MADTATVESEIDYETHIEPKCISKDELGYLDVSDVISADDKSYVLFHVKGSGLLNAEEVEKLMTWLTEWTEART